MYTSHEADSLINIHTWIRYINPQDLFMKYKVIYIFFLFEGVWSLCTVGGDEYCVWPTETAAQDWTFASPAGKCRNKRGFPGLDSSTSGSIKTQNISVILNSFSLLFIVLVAWGPLWLCRPGRLWACPGPPAWAGCLSLPSRLPHPAFSEAGVSSTSATHPRSASGLQGWWMWLRHKRQQLVTIWHTQIIIVILFPWL